MDVVRKIEGEPISDYCWARFALWIKALSELNMSDRACSCDQNGATIDPNHTSWCEILSGIRVESGS
jgi:hypothetical protein